MTTLELKSKPQNGSTIGFELYYLPDTNTWIAPLPIFLSIYFTRTNLTAMEYIVYEVSGLIGLVISLLLLFGFDSDLSC